MLNILLIDDDDELLVLLKTYLESKPNIKVDTANSYAAGVDAINARRHDIYIIDYELDNARTGMDLVVQAHALDLSPLIMLTSINDDRLAESAMLIGCCDFVCKMNLNLDDFYHAIQKNLTKIEEHSK